MPLLIAMKRNLFQLGSLFMTFLLSLSCLVSYAAALEVAESRYGSANNEETSLFEELADNPDFVEIKESPLVTIDLRYATENNFVGTNLYGSFNRCYLHKEAAKKLKTASEHLEKGRPGWKLLIFDCLRPRSVQKILFERVKGTQYESYVANPKKGSVHNYGFAVDLSLQDEKGREVDMGTPFDSFSRLSHPHMEKEFLRVGKLSREQVANRLILRDSMEKSGFVQLSIEWWHYDALPSRQVRKKYQIVE